MSMTTPYQTHQIKYDNVYKLNTKEDSTHIHKTLGIIVLIHFLYRYIYFILNGHMNFQEDNIIHLYFIFLHGVLSVSSLLFHISNYRNTQQPMIYPESRLHTIIFTLRSVICCIIHFYKYNYIYHIITCSSTIITADIVTYYYNRTGKNGQTMRNMPYDKTVPAEEQEQIKIMQSTSQIGATLYMFGNIETAFSPMFAIQFASFLMTMVRKGIINGYLWHTYYSLSLWINFILFINLTPAYMLLMQVIYYIHYCIIFKYKINKYLAWTSHFTCIVLYKEYELETIINTIVIENYPVEWYYFIRIVVVLTYLYMFYRYRVMFMSL